jgi:cytochrome P450
MFKKLFGESKMDKLEARFAAMEAEKVEAAEDNARLLEEKTALEAELAEKVKTPKEKANEAGESYIDVLETIFEDPKNPGAGYFELDWNDLFVKSLTEAGYSGRTDDEIVNMWFDDLCRGVVGDKI